MSRCNLLYWPPEYTGSASYNSFVFVLFLLNCYQSEMSFLNHTNCPKPAQRLYFSSVFWDCPGASFQQDLPKTPHLLGAQVVYLITMVLMITMIHSDYQQLVLVPLSPLQYKISST